MFVADPLFTIWLSIAAIMLIIAKSTDTRRHRWAKWGIALSTVYLVWGVVSKNLVDRHTHKELALQGIVPDK
jgi:hypothetical protein